MVDQSQSNGRHVEQEWSSKPPRIPRLATYQVRWQLPWTLLALIVIATVAFVAWVLTP